jgi:23S rRNA A2030 N6-methylase RlmJ
MYGSGMAIVNPPWRMDEELATVMPAVAQIIAPTTARVSVRQLGAGPANGR